MACKNKLAVVKNSFKKIKVQNILQTYLGSLRVPCCRMLMRFSYLILVPEHLPGRVHQNYHSNSDHPEKCHICAIFDHFYTLRKSAKQVSYANFPKHCVHCHIMMIQHSLISSSQFQLGKSCQRLQILQLLGITFRKYPKYSSFRRKIYNSIVFGQIFKNHT